MILQVLLKIGMMTPANMKATDHVMKHLVKVRYLGIPPAVASQLVQPEDQPEEGAGSATIYPEL